MPAVLALSQVPCVALKLIPPPGDKSEEIVLIEVLHCQPPIDSFEFGPAVPVGLLLTWLGQDFVGNTGAGCGSPPEILDPQRATVDAGVGEREQWCRHEPTTAPSSYLAYKMRDTCAVTVVG